MPPLRPRLSVTLAGGSANVVRLPSWRTEALAVKDRNDPQQPVVGGSDQSIESVYTTIGAVTELMYRDIGRVSEEVGLISGTLNALASPLAYVFRLFGFGGSDGETPGLPAGVIGDTLRRHGEGLTVLTQDVGSVRDRLRRLESDSLEAFAAIADNPVLGLVPDLNGSRARLYAVIGSIRERQV